MGETHSAGKTVALVIAQNVFRDEEYIQPKEVLQQAGVHVITASSARTVAHGTRGARVMPDVTLQELDPEALDGVFFIGGGGAEEYFDNAAAHELARRMVSLEKALGAICIAPTILANAGVLRGRRATVFRSGTSALARGGATYTGEGVTVDGLLITADGPASARAFGEAILNVLQHT